MSKEALITINCKRYSERIVDIINLFDQSGWKYYYAKKILNICLLVRVMILIGKKFGGGITRSYRKKQDKQELVGLIMYYKNFDEGITILAKNTNEMVISLDINKKQLKLAESRLQI